MSVFNKNGGMDLIKLTTLSEIVDPGRPQELIGTIKTVELGTNQEQVSAPTGTFEPLEPLIVNALIKIELDELVNIRSIFDLEDRKVTVTIDK